MDMTNAEIGELMGLNPVSVSQRYHRLLEKCRKLDGNP
ncbi:MAG: sigma-70 family RNA polymerase sigma factor [Spirochaetia bacterium]|nr:sigma-70 family RNA polymerase sigma factor [Spirochaetia bacterium]